MKSSSCASHAHAPTSGRTCLGFPKESRAGPGEREDLGTNCISGKEERPLSMGVSVQLEEGSLKGKVKREKKVLGPVSGELIWRQVRELKSHCRRAAWIA